MLYRGADMLLARPGRKQANVFVRMAWISFDDLLCKKIKTWWQLTSRFCWNRARPWHASELVSILVGLRTYQHAGYVPWIFLRFSYSDQQLQFPHHTCTKESPHIEMESARYFQNVSIRTEKNEMGGSCSAYGGWEGRIQGFGVEAWGRRPLGRPRLRWEDNIKMDLQEMLCGVWIGSSWIRIGTGGGHL